MSKLEKRTFKVIESTNVELNGRSCAGKTPLEACKDLIRRRCTSNHSFTMTIKETTKGGKNKVYTYVVRKTSRGSYQIAVKSKQRGGGPDVKEVPRKLELDELEDIVSDRKPELIQHNLTENLTNCKFVIITYWWGRGNTNRNLQYPCPEDQTPDEVTAFKEKSKTGEFNFEKMIDSWKDNIESQNCYYYVEEYPEFAKPGYYQQGINIKPMFIKRALDKCSEIFAKEGKDFRGVVYIDGDMTVNEFPSIFNLDNIDYMARGWNIDPRANRNFRKNKFCFDPYMFETSGGIMFFGDTVYSRQLLDIWKISSSNKLNDGKADDRIISLMFNAMGLFIPYNTIQLPIEYLWLTDNYGEKKEGGKGKIGFVTHNLQDEPDDKSGSIIFEHPACLTGEERATEQGASANRHPLYYTSLVENRVNCTRHAGMFYEWIYFYNGEEPMANNSRNALYSYKNYLEYMSDIYFEDGETPPFYVIPYDEGYWKFKTAVVDPRLRRLSTYLGTELKIENVLNDGLESTSSADVNVYQYITLMSNLDTSPEVVIDDILMYLMQGDDVLLLPNTEKYQQYVESYHIELSPSSSPATSQATSQATSRATSRTTSTNLNATQNGGDNRNIHDIIDYIKTNVPIDCEFVAYIDNFKLVRDYEDVLNKKIEALRDLIVSSDANRLNPKLDTEKPMYFSHKSRVLRHLLLMSKGIKSSDKQTSFYYKFGEEQRKVYAGLNEIFNSSFIFPTRIRCNWLHINEVPMTRPITTITKAIITAKAITRPRRDSPRVNNWVGRKPNSPRS